MGFHERDIGFVPIGAIVAVADDYSANVSNAWNEVFECFMECNGQPVIDPRSPLYGMNMPDLNEGQSRFLCGQIDGQPHGYTAGESTHTLTTTQCPAALEVGVSVTKGTIGGVGITSVVTNVAAQLNIGGGQPHENRPPFFCVRWYMRVV